MSNVNNVSVGQPKVGGAVYVAPTGTTLPTDATTSLNVAFVCLGYISEDGLTNSNSIESTSFKAWGGDEVLNVQTGKTDTFKFKLIESLNLDVMKYIYGSANVTGALNTGVTIDVNADEQVEQSMVAEMVMRGGTLKRVVIPAAKLTAIDDIVYKGSDMIGYGCTVSAAVDSSGNTHYEYIIEQ